MNDKQVKVLMVTAEAVPFAKTGGLADVVGVLPKELRKLGVDARVVMPLYKCVKEKFAADLEFVRWSMLRMGWRTLYAGLFRCNYEGVEYYFIDNEYYFGYDEIYKDYDFDIERFCFFQKAVLEALGQAMRFYPDIIHCHDWQAGLIPVLLQAQYQQFGYFPEIRTLLTIHNLRFQGYTSYEKIADLTGLDNSYLNDYGVLKDGYANFLKAGIVYADKINTVSHTYAQEIMYEFYGERLETVLNYYKNKLCGITNGIDTVEFNPATDPTLVKNYSVSDFAQGKAKNKVAVQKQLNLTVDEDVPLIVMISRLTDQKGLDLFNCIAEDLLKMEDCQIVILGTGPSMYEDSLRYFSNKYPQKMRACLRFDDHFSNLLYAGADLLLMPSIFEPCGLSQMIAMRYGTLPIVRETGGLVDTVQPYNRYEHSGNGFSFTNINAHDFLHVICQALRLYRAYHNGENMDFANLITTAMKCDFSWNNAGKEYLKLYESMIE